MEEFTPHQSVANTVWMFFLSFLCLSSDFSQLVLGKLLLTQRLGLLLGPYQFWIISELAFMLYVWQFSGKNCFYLQLEGQNFPCIAFFYRIEEKLNNSVMLWL